ncbi:copper amine oxidase N-terminal domain-containing protein [Paenibacillus sp. TH7-28]
MKYVISFAKAAAALMLSLTVAAGALPGMQPFSATAAAAAAKGPIIYGLEHATFKQSGQLYLPLKEVAPLLDLQVGYDNTTKTTEVTGVQQLAKLKSGKSSATGKSGKTVALGAPILVKNGDTYVPASLFSKLFGISIKAGNAKEPSEISFSYNPQYFTLRSGSMLFWMNKQHGVIYAGPSGQLPERAGKVTVRDPDWLGGKAQKIDDSTYVLDISNSYGEPHINNSWYRILLHDGKIVRQSAMHFGGPPFGNLHENVLTYDGRIVLNNGQIAKLYTKDGQLTETINLVQFGDTEDVYSLEALEDDFLLIRPYSSGTLLLIDRKTGERTAPYLKLLQEDDIQWIQMNDLNADDGLTYTGRTGSILHFDWEGFNSSPGGSKSLDLTSAFEKNDE